MVQNQKYQSLFSLFIGNIQNLKICFENQFKYFVLIATYGRISTGVLWESSKLVKAKLLQRLVPTGHTYLDNLQI